MRGMMLTIACLAIGPVAANAVAPVPTAASISSGDYREMLIGVDPFSHIVSGYFQSSTGEGKFSCIFYFSGKATSDGTPIRSYFPDTPGDVIAGKIIAEGRDQVRVELADEHGGCWNVEHFADAAQPAEFSLAKAYPWVSIAVVKSERAHFFDLPQNIAPRKTYVVRGDGLGVRAVRPGWLQVDFVGSGRTVTGWIRRADVYPLG